MLYLFKENIVFVKIFETPFGSIILASFIEFECQSTDTFGFFRVQIQDSFWHKKCVGIPLKSRRAVVFGDQGNKC